MRTFLLTVGALAMAIALGSCGGGDDDDQSASRTTADQAETTDATGGGTTTQRRETTERDDATTDRDDSAADDSAGDDDGEAPAQDDEPSGSTADSDAEAAARATVTAFFGALADGDGAKACSLMIEKVKEQLDKGLSQTPQFKGKDCEGLISSLSKNYPDATRAQMKSLEVVKTQAKGNVVVVSYKGLANTNAQVPVVNEDGAWKIGAATGTP